MNVLENVRLARIRLKKHNRSEHANYEAIEDLMEEAQKLIGEMNAAKLKAMKDAEAPYIEQLKELDDQMSVFIALIG